MKLPKCHKCGKPASHHKILRGQLACLWDGSSLVQSGDWGDLTPLIVESVFRFTKRKVPYELAKAVIEAERRGLRL